MGRKGKGKKGENRYKEEGKGKTERKGGTRRGNGKEDKVCSRNFQLF